MNNARRNQTNSPEEFIRICQANDFDQFVIVATSSRRKGIAHYASASLTGMDFDHENWHYTGKDIAYAADTEKGGAQ